MSNVVVDYKKIMDTISVQFFSIKPDDIELHIEDEQSWNKEKDRDPNALYIVVHFGETSVNFAQASAEVNLEVLGINNEVEKTQEFLNQFVTEFNRKQVDSLTQYYLSPTVSQRFNEMYDGFRTLFNIEGVILILPNIIKAQKLKYWWKLPPIGGHGAPIWRNETIDMVSFNDVTENAMNPQPYFNNYGRTKSYAKFQTYAFTIVLYPTSNIQLIKDVMKARFENTNSQNKDFMFTFEFENFNGSSGPTLQNATQTSAWTFKLTNVQFVQNVGETPVITVSFSL